MMKYRDTDDLTLESSVFDRFELIRNIKAINKKSPIALTSREKDILEYYVSLTRKQDWMAGSRPIMYQNLTATAEYFGITERAVQYIETSLLEKGYITYSNDGSGGFRRYGRRDRESGLLLHACGVNLAPLALKQDEITKELERQRLLLEQKSALKRAISSYRGKISMIFKDFTPDDIVDNYKPLKKPIRAYMSVDTLNSVLNSLKALYERLRREFEAFLNSSCGQVKKTSSEDEINSVKLDSTKMIESSSRISNGSAVGCKKNSASAPSSSTYEDNLTTAQIYMGSSSRFKEKLNKQEGQFTDCYITAAKQTAMGLGVSKKVWLHAEKIMSPIRAAVCMALIDEKLEDGQDIRNVDLYLCGMVKKYKSGKLNLLGGVLGACERQKAFEMSLS